MRKIVIVAFFSFFVIHASGQWNTSNPPHVYYTLGNVGIGVTNPGNSRLSVRHEASQAYHNAFTLSSINPNDHWPFVLTSNNLPNHSGFVSQADGDIYFLLRDKDGNADVQLHSEGNNFVMGKLGLGLASPEGKLHVAGVAYIGNENGYSSHRVAIGGSGGNYGSIGYGYKYTTEDSKHIYAVADNASQLEFKQGGFVFKTAPVGTAGTQVNFTDAMHILQNGKVGIGTHNPAYNLQVNSSAAANLRLVSNGSTSTAPSLDMIDNVNGTEFTISPSLGKVDLFTFSNHPLVLGTANAERMRITQTGKVGIGLTNPEGKLHMNGVAYFGNENGDSWHRIAIGGSGGNYGSVGYGYKYTLNSNEFRYSVADYASQLEFATGGFTFKTASIGVAGNIVSFTNALRINQNGDVGIGTSSPDAKLAVKGTVHAQEVKVDLLVPGPDYVFEPTYNLPTLAETEAYIKANKHLPEVPSAKEMEANGINLSEMNMLLLKKVEELTLHLINQQSEISELREQIKKLNP